MVTVTARRRPIVLEHEDQVDLSLRLAQLRHLYAMLKADPKYGEEANDPFGLSVADGLLAPQIEAIEKILDKR